ncbi:MAG: UvrD-helicase domain-containing protein [Holosporales bacterium]|jgi:DNA helicase-2/ATP-dependent DNA helicase PcrA|nr:UvrD-helicase domain-containing protein [Holosporales bacterium]
MVFDISSLNDEQREAVKATDGAVLVIAGAGTGKTKVLTTRIAHIVSSGLCSIDEILAVTFTNKAAKEMLERATILLKEAGICVEIANRPWIGTFHSLALRMIRPLHEKFYRSANFSIVDAGDQLMIVKKIMHDLGCDDKKFPPKSMVFHINRWKDQYQSVESAKKNVQRFSGEEMASKIYIHYQDTLHSLDAIDFGDILMYCLDILKYNADILMGYQNKFKYIMIDEYQDTNLAQYLWIKMLSQGHGNICCVGDDDQAIYSWRGADVGNILKFESNFNGAKIIRLGKNYRSTGNILKTASTLISNNSMRMQKSFWTDEESGLPVVIKTLRNAVEEAQFVASLIANKHKNGTALSEIAILVRAAFQTRAFEERLLAMGVPYTVIGGIRFYERKEVKDAIAYLRLTINPNDGIAFERIVNLPRRGIGSTTMSQFYDVARGQGISIPQAARQVSRKLDDFFRLLDEWSELIDCSKSVKDVMKRILNDSGYISMLKESKNLEDESRLETLDELLSSLDDFSSPTEFLDYVGLVLDHTSSAIQDRVIISTIHSAKGLEYKTIFIPGFEENIIPNQRSVMEKGELGVEEERRLCYVALTRARKEAYITLCEIRNTYGHGGGGGGWSYVKPSRFLQNMPKSSVRIL